MAWLERLHADPLPWLLAEDTPAVRVAALQCLLDRPVDDGDVRAARAATMTRNPIKAILDAQSPAGWWVKPGPGYATKYRGSVWQVIFLDQLGADPDDERVRRGCSYVLAHSIASSGGFASSGSKAEAAPPPSTVIHCLNGNLLAALIGFGYVDDPRVQGAVAWGARAITGEGMDRWYRSGTGGPGFACAANEQQPCAWGAVKELRALTRVPLERRTPLVNRALEQGSDFLLSRDPAAADYPMGFGNTTPSSSWYKLGFPSAYVTDVLQNLEVLVDLGHGHDARLTRAVDWLLGQQDARGRCRNRYAYNGKTWCDIEPQGQPSKWVTLRACRVLRAVLG